MRNYNFDDDQKTNEIRSVVVLEDYDEIGFFGQYKNKQIIVLMDDFSIYLCKQSKCGVSTYKKITRKRKSFQWKYNGIIESKS